MFEERVIDYKVVYGDSFSELEGRVLERLAENWKLRGEIHELCMPNFSINGYVYAQVMVKIVGYEGQTISGGAAKVKIPENTLYGMG